MRAGLAWQRGSGGKLQSARPSPFKGEAGRGMGWEDLPPLSTRVESLMERRDLRHGFFMLEGLICFVAAVRPATLVRGIKNICAAHCPDARKGLFLAFGLGNFMFSQRN